MARARNIKPSFFLNEDLAAIHPFGRLLFQGLWCMADRAGRLEDRPLRIKATILPYDNCDIEALLSSLVAAGFIHRYAANGNGYIQVRNFEKHQYPHVKEPASTIPAPDKNHTSMVPVRLNPESPILNPESPFLNTRPEAPSLKFDFELLWNKYPTKDGKKSAIRSFKASVKTEQDWLDIQKALDNYLKADRVQNGYIKNGSTWFANWRDWINYTEDKHVKTITPSGGYVGTTPPAGKYAKIAENDKPLTTNT